MYGKPFEKDRLSPAPWKNGGGVTREIATAFPGRAYWRMSIADVESDGAFSQFPGHHRILTVIAGHGMQLDVGEQTISAVPFSPVRFDGEVLVNGQLMDGPVQNFNLIFDPQALNAQVLVGSITSLRADIQADVDTAMIYCLRGAVRTKSAGLIQADSGVFIEDPIDFLAAGEADVGLWVGLREIH